MPVGRMRKGKLTTSSARHSVAVSVASDEDGNVSDCGELTNKINSTTVNAAYNNNKQQKKHSIQSKCTSNISQCEDDQNQNDETNINLNSLDLKLSNGEDVIRVSQTSQ